MTDYPVFGYDISAWQNAKDRIGTVDFNKMKSTGAQFVFCRALFGLTKDVDFAEYWALAKQAGLKRGAYMFLIPNYNIDTQVNLFCDMLQADKGEIEPVIDVESWSGNTPTANMILMVRGTIVRRLGVMPIIYTGYYVWRDNVKSVDPLFLDHPLWIATYGSSPLIPSPWKTWRFWQYTDKGDGAKAGVESLNIDCDYFNGTQAQFDALYSGQKPIGGEVTPPPPVDNTNTGGNVATTNIYANKAKLIAVHEGHTNISAVPANVDGALILAYAGETANPLFTTQLQTFYDAKKISLSWVAPYIAGYAGIGSGGIAGDVHDFSKWPPYTTGVAGNQQDYNFKMMDKAFKMANGVVRGFDGVVLDMRDVFDPNSKKPLPSNWVAKSIRYLTEGIWARYKKPWFVLLADAKDSTRGYGELFGDSEKDAMMIQVCSEDIGAFVQWSSLPTMDRTDPSFPIPTGDLKPGVHLYYAPSWFGWWDSAASFGGIKGLGGASVVCPTMISSLDRKKFYEYFGKIAPDNGTVTPPPPPPVDPPPVNPPVVGAKAELDNFIAGWETKWNIK